jgi:hypothetical protein
MQSEESELSTVGSDIDHRAVLVRKHYVLVLSCGGNPMHERSTITRLGEYSTKLVRLVEIVSKKSIEGQNCAPIYEADGMGG